MDLASQLARLLASHIVQPTNIDTPDTKSKGNIRDLIIQIIGNVSATGGSRLFVGVSSAASNDGVDAPPKGISVSCSWRWVNEQSSV